MRGLLATLCCWLIATSASAQALAELHAGPQTIGGYVGPGDLVSGATVWFGLRGYNAAYATGSNKAINVRRASDNTTSDINILSTGALDIASANTFAGTDATCQGSTSGLSTTIAFTSCSSTPHAGSTLTGSGLTQPSYLASCGSFVAGAGSCTLNASQNIAVAETITMQYGLYVTEMYDQSGNGSNITQATAGNQPQLLPLCVNSLPCAFMSTGNQGWSGTITSVNVAQSFSETIDVTTGSGGFNCETSAPNGLSVQSGPALGVSGASAIVSSATISTNVWYRFQGSINGASSINYVSGTLVTGTTNTRTSGATFTMQSGTGTNVRMGECGMWNSTAFNSTQYQGLDTNQHNYWGF